MEALGFGLIVTLIGMIVTFIGLTILILLINGLVRVTTHKKKSETIANRSVDAVTKDAEILPLVKTDDAENEAYNFTACDSSVVAAVTAALTVVMQSDGDFIVRRIRRIA